MPTFILVRKNPQLFLLNYKGKRNSILRHLSGRPYELSVVQEDVSVWVGSKGIFFCGLQMLMQPPLPLPTHFLGYWLCRLMEHLCRKLNVTTNSKSFIASINLIFCITLCSGSAMSLAFGWCLLNYYKQEVMLSSISLYSIPALLEEGSTKLCDPSVLIMLAVCSIVGQDLDTPTLYLCNIYGGGAATHRSSLGIYKF